MPLFILKLYLFKACLEEIAISTVCCIASDMFFYCVLFDALNKNFLRVILTIFLVQSLDS